MGGLLGIPGLSWVGLVAWVVRKEGCVLLRSDIREMIMTWTWVAR